MMPASQLSDPFDWVAAAKEITNTFVPPELLSAVRHSTNIGPTQDWDTFVVFFHTAKDSPVSTLTISYNRPSHALHYAQNMVEGSLLFDKVAHGFKTIVADYNFCTLTSDLSSLLRFGIDRFKEVCEFPSIFTLTDSFYTYPSSSGPDELSFAGATLVRISSKDRTPASLRGCVASRIMALDAMSYGRVAGPAALMRLDEGDKGARYATLPDTQLPNYTEDLPGFLLGIENLQSDLLEAEKGGVE